MSDDYRVQVSISMPPVAQYAKGDMVNFRGETAAEVEALLDEALEGDLFEKAALASKTFLAASGLAEAAEKRDAAPAKSKRSSKSDDEDNVVGSKRFCEHGKRRYVKKPNWAGWFCPLEKGDPDQCDPVWED